MQHPPKLTPEELGSNVNTLNEFKRALELQQIGKKTINLYLWKAYQILRHCGKPAAKMTRTEIQDYIIKRRETSSQWTVNGDIIALRKFFGWR